MAFETQQGVDTLQWMLDATRRVYGDRAVDTFLADLQAANTGQGTSANIPRYQGKVGMWTRRWPSSSS